LKRPGLCYTLMADSDGLPGGVHQLRLTRNRRQNSRLFSLNQKITGLAIIIFTLAVLIAVTFYGFFQVDPSIYRAEKGKTEPSEPLIIVWEYAAIETEPSTISRMPSLQIVSPTWFHIIDETGTIESHFDKDYLLWARERGYDVWALVTNSFDPDITAAILSNEEIRYSIVENLISLALKYELEGLNIDFENFHSDYRDLFTKFISELAERCREENIIVSVDVTMISNSTHWSGGYDRAALAEAANYIILMAYDEHWVTSPVAGSVASLPWVERGLARVLNEVPPEKLILGVPFYTRLWQIDKSGDEPLVLNSWSYSMPRAEEIIEENEANIHWDSDALQYVATYTKNGLDYIMWLEDTTSMSYRLELVNRYELAGVAGWRRGLEKEEIWLLIDDWQTITR